MLRKGVLVALVVVFTIAGFRLVSHSQSEASPGVIFRIVSQALFESINDYTGLSSADVLKELGAGGKSLSDVITAHNVNAADIAADAKIRVMLGVNQDMQNGLLTSDQAQGLTFNLDGEIAQVMHYVWPAQQDLTAGLVRLSATVTLIDQMEKAKIQDFAIFAGLNQGQTLAQIATNQKADPTQIISGAVAETTNRLNQLVTANKLTKDQAAKLIAGLQDSYTKIMNASNPLTGASGTPAAATAEATEEAGK